MNNNRIQTRVNLPNLVIACTLILLFIISNVYAASYKQEAQDLQNIINSKLENNKNYLNQAQQISKQNKVNLQETVSKHQNLKAITDIAITKTNSKKYQDHLNRIFPTVNLKELNAAYAEKQHKHLNQLMIFVSSSMPKVALKQYSVQAKKAGAVLVLRGLINNSFKTTTSFIYSLNKEGTTAIIDPLSYRNFNITQVPQIVIITDNHGCKWGRCDHTPIHDKIQGNVTLEYALTEISKKGEFTKKEAARFLEVLRSS